MNVPLGPQPRQRRDRVRYQARLGAEAQARLEDLLKTFHRKRRQILRHVMEWGIPRSAGWIIDDSIPASPHLVSMLLEPALRQQVQDAAAAHGVSMAAWLRHAMRQVTREDCPANWRAGRPADRSHETGYFRRKCMLRLDEETSTKLEALTQAYHCSAAEVIRQLIVLAAPEDFPQNWQLALEEYRQGTIT